MLECLIKHLSEWMYSNYTICSSDGSATVVCDQWGVKTSASQGAKMMINDQMVLEEEYDENYVPPEEGRS